MGTSRSALELGRKFDSLSREIEQRQVESARDGARIIEQAVNGRLRAATGGDFALSGINRSATLTKSGKERSKGRMGVKVRPARGETGAFLVAATGPVQLVENDVQKHIVVSRYAKGASFTRTTKAGRTVKGRSSRQSRIASVAFGLGAGGGDRRAVLHWGGNNYARYTTASSKGRHPWRNGKRASEGRAAAAMRAPHIQAVGKVFR